MDTEPFYWKEWESGELPELASHSKFKLEVLRNYVESYIEILFANNFGVREAELNIVDGFCGGGIYQNNEPGSPLVFMNALKVAEFKINQIRKTPFKIRPKFFFIDENRSALNCLRNQIHQAGNGAEIDQTIFLIHGCFSEKYKKVLEATTKRNGKSSRTIFFLDQCGYSKVDMRLIPEISQAAGYKAEFIINLAITWMLDFMRDDKEFRKLYEKIGVSDFVGLDELLRIKNEKQGDWHYAIESKIGPAIKAATKSEYYSPFYVRPADSRRGYWLLHLAPHERARTAMMDVLWSKGDGSLHYGGKGLKMHEFKPDLDPSAYFEGFSLNEINKETCKLDLAKDLAAYMAENQVSSITFADLVKAVCNDTVANPEIIKGSLLLLKSTSEITIHGKANGTKRSDSILSTDLIKLASQKVFSFYPHTPRRK